MLEKLELLLADSVIDEVVGRLKSGKEADLWIVRHAGEVAAAKIYKERDERSFRNNAAYTEGRQVRNSRTRRAMERGSAFGKQAAEQEWKSAEADTIFKLHAQGVRTPKPLMFYEGVLLMELVTDAEGQPAPRLIDAALTAEAAGIVYRDLRTQVVRMLSADVIHGDLSPYNVLLGAGGPTIIDFPQSIAAAHNNRSEQFFTRDLENLRKHLAGHDRSLHACGGDAHEIWHAYVRRELTPDFVPTGRVPERRTHPPQRHAQGGEGRVPPPHGAGHSRDGRQHGPRQSGLSGPSRGPHHATQQRGEQQGQGEPQRASPQNGGRPPDGHQRRDQQQSRQQNSGQRFSDPQRSGRQGSPPRGGQDAGQQRSGQQHSGQQHSGQQHSGQQHSGQQRSGQQHSGQQHSGQQRSGQQYSGPRNRGPAGETERGGGPRPSGPNDDRRGRGAPKQGPVVERIIRPAAPSASGRDATAAKPPQSSQGRPQHPTASPPPRAVSGRSWRR